MKSNPNRKEKDVVILDDLRAAPTGAILFCRACKGEFSADPGDYFMQPEDKGFRCCHRPLVLMTKRVVYTVVPTRAS